MTTTIENPYAPTEAEAPILAAFLDARERGEATIGLHDSFLAGVRTAATLPAEQEDQAWMTWVDADIKMKTDYPTVADAFIGGFRAI